MTSVVSHPSVVKGSGFLKDGRIWIESNRGTMFTRWAGSNFKLHGGLTSIELDVMSLAISVNLSGHVRRKSVHNRWANAVKTWWHLIATVAKFTAGVEHGEHRLESRLLSLGVDINWDTTAVIVDTDATVLQDSYIYLVSKTSDSFIDGVIGNFFY